MPASMVHRLSPIIQSPVNLPQLQMQIAADSDDNLPALFLQELQRLGMVAPAVAGMNANRMWVLTQKGRTKIRDTQFSQRFPPDQIYDIDTRQLLQNLADSFIASFEEHVNHHTYAREKAIVLHTMLDLVDEATGTFKVDRAEWAQQWAHRQGIKGWQLMINGTEVMDNVTHDSCMLAQAHILMREMVGLIAKDFERPFVQDSSPFIQSGSSTVDASVLALAVFSRESLFDDSRGSLRTKIEEAVSGKAPVAYYDDPANKQFNVFAIEGVADTPGLTEGLARILLSKIEEYARKEQKIVVVQKQAHTSSDGTDLTEYYEQLGFEKVVMEHGLHELVYTGKSYSATSFSEVEDMPIMVGMNFWGL